MNMLAVLSERLLFGVSVLCLERRYGRVVSFVLVELLVIILEGGRDC